MSVLALLRELVEDKACFLCGEESRLPICPECASAFRRCDQCWSDSKLASGVACGFSAYWYEGRLRQAVLQMKVQGEYQLGGQLASLLVHVAASLQFPPASLFVPVPRFGESAQVTSHRFPQVASRALAQAFEGEYGGQLLQKNRRTPLQTELTDEQRLANVAGAFCTAEDAAARMQGRSVVVVDDVLTTGSTIHAVTTTILKTCPNQCLYLTLARSRATIRAGL